MDILIYSMAVFMAFNVFFVFFMIFALRRLAKRLEDQAVKKAVDRIFFSLSPFVKDFKDLSLGFEEHLREKKKLIQTLNESLDKRVSALKLLLNRSELILEQRNLSSDKNENYDLNDRVLLLAREGRDAASIAREVGVSQGEVDMILDLKRRFDKFSHPAS